MRSALPTFLRYSLLAGAAELGPAGLRQSSPLIRHQLRCSARHMGTRKSVYAEPVELVFVFFRWSTAVINILAVFYG